MAKTRHTPLKGTPADSPDGSRSEWWFVAAVLLLAGLVFLFLRFTGRDTGLLQNGGYRYGVAEQQPSKAEPIPGLPAEVLVTQGHFVNSSTGDNILYEVQVVATVSNPKGAYAEDLSQNHLMRKSQDHINTQIADIIRKAHPERFREEGLETLSRQFRAVVNHRLRQDNLPPVEDILITKMIPIRQLD